MSHCSPSVSLEETATVARSFSDMTITPMKSIYDLLHETPTNWNLIQHRAMTDRASFPQDFVALMFMLGEPGPPLLLLEWFMVEFSDSAGYLGFGCSSNQELPARAMRWVRSSVAGMGWHLRSKMPHGTEGLFSNLVSLEGAKAIIAAFYGTEYIQSSLYIYIFDGHTRDLRNNRYDYFVGLLEVYLHRTVTRSKDRWFLREKEFLVGHALLYLFHEHWLRYDGPSRRSVANCISFVHTRGSPNVFYEQNDGCSTVLDLILDRAGIFPVIIDGRLGKDKAPAFQYFVVHELLQVYPSLCLIRNGKGQLPIHVAPNLWNHPFRNQLIALILDTAPEVVERRCVATGLYPFQIAASKGRSLSTCSCETCKSLGVSLNNIFVLLRQSPALVASGIPPDSSIRAEHAIECALASLAVSRKRRNVDLLKRELETAECDLPSPRGTFVTTRWSRETW